MPERSPLVVLTRSEDRNAPLRAALEALGLEVIELPCVRTEPIDPASLTAAFDGVTARDLVVLTSAAAVKAVAPLVREIGADVATVGPATAAAARAAGLRVGFVASRADGETLAAELPLPAGDVVLARSDRARPDLPRLLHARGARVREVVAYRTVPGASADVHEARAAIDAGAAVVLASPSAVEGLLGAIAREGLRRARLVAVGPTTASAIREWIGVDPLVAGDPSTEAVARTVAVALRAAVPA